MSPKYCSQDSRLTIAKNVASTFKGVIRALREFAPVLIEHDVQIWVRRAGPNYQEGLKNIKSAGQELKLNMHVYGPECKFVLLHTSWATTNVQRNRPCFWHCSYGSPRQEPQWCPGVLWLSPGFFVYLFSILLKIKASRIGWASSHARCAMCYGFNKGNEFFCSGGGVGGYVATCRYPWVGLVNESEIYIS